MVFFGYKMLMITQAIAKQFTLKDDGQIYFQADSTNPLPGNPIAQIVKGSSLFQPDIEFILPDDQNNDETKLYITNWMKAYLCTVLAPLVTMLEGADTPPVVQSLFIRLFQNLGIMKRGELDDLISQLDAEQRKLIRAKKVKLGPILVFLPELNKPAAVRVRGLLWALFNDWSLPAPLPRDGSVSMKIDPITANKDFYQAIGYPIYADRAIRIDMVDRVMSAIYDSADKGKFKAQHAYAEWMGCGIPDLYAILNAMGHRQIEKPVVETTVVDVPSETIGDVETPEVTAETVITEVSETPAQPKVKPELDEFFLRKGVAHKERAPRNDYQKPSYGRNNHSSESQTGDTPQREFKRREFSKPDANSKQDKPKFAPERTFGKPGDMKRKRDDSNGRDENRPRKFNKSRDREDDRNQEARVFSAEAKTVDNPFAVLGQLKTKH